MNVRQRLERLESAIAPKETVPSAFEEMELILADPVARELVCDVEAALVASASGGPEEEAAYVKVRAALDARLKVLHRRRLDGDGHSQEAGGPGDGLDA